MRKSGITWRIEIVFTVTALNYKSNFPCMRYYFSDSIRQFFCNQAPNGSFPSRSFSNSFWPNGPADVFGLPLSFANIRMSAFADFKNAP